MSAGPEGVKVEDLSYATGRRTGLTPRLGKAGELTLVVQVQESGWADPLSYHAGPDPVLSVGTPPHLPLP